MHESHITFNIYQDDEMFEVLLAKSSDEVFKSPFEIRTKVVQTENRNPKLNTHYNYACGDILQYAIIRKVDLKHVGRLLEKGANVNREYQVSLHIYICIYMHTNIRTYDKHALIKWYLYPICCRDKIGVSLDC